MKEAKLSSPTIGAFLRLPQVLELIPIGKSTLWLWVKTDRFPQPVKLGPRTTVWMAEEIKAYIERATLEGRG